MYSADDAISMLNATGCDGIMIGRGAEGNPWIFEEIVARLEGKQFIAPSLEKRFETAVRQLEDTVASKGEKVGIAEAKKHMAWYTNGLRDSAAARAAIMTSNSVDDIKKIFDRLLLTENL